MSEKKGFVGLFAHFIITFRWPVVIAVTLITLYFTYLLRYVSLPKELADIKPKGHPNVILQNYMDEAFGVGSMISIALEVKEGTIFNPTTLGKLKRVCENIYKLKGAMPGQVISVASKSRVKNTRTVLDDQGFSTLLVQNYKDLVTRAIADPKQMEDYRQQLLNNEQIYGRMVSWDQKSATIQAHFWNDKDFKNIFAAVRKILHDEEDANHKFYVAGRVMEMGFLHMYMGKIVMVFGIATLVVILVLWIAFGTWRGVLMPLWAAYVAVSWGLGSEYLLGMEMDIMTIIVPFMVMAMEVSHCVQILTRFYEEYGKWGDNQRAAEETLAGLVIPGVASIVTDGAGFATLFLIPFKLLQQMATSATFGVLRIFFTTTVFIHAFVAILPAPTVKEMAKIHRRDRLFKGILRKVADLTYGNSRLAVIGVAMALMAVAVIGTTRVQVGDMEAGSPLFWADSEYNRAEKVLNDHFMGTNPYVIHIKGDKASVMANPQLVREIHSLQKHLEERPDVGATTAYPDVLKGINMAFHDNDPRWYVIPSDYEMTWQFMDIFRTGGGPEDSKGYFEIDYSEGPMTVYVKDHKGRTIRDIMSDTDRYLAQNKKTNEAHVRQAAGIIGIFAAIMDEIKKSQIDSLWQISLVVFLFCVVTYRSFAAGLIILIPLALGTLITFATMGYGEVGLFIYTVPVASMGMGLGVDYSLYVVSRMKEELESGKSYKDAHYETLTNSGKAVFFTAMSLALGVATLLLSFIRFQAILGGMLMVVLVANMLGAILLLPAFLSWWKPKFLFPKGAVSR